MQEDTTSFSRGSSGAQVSVPFGRGSGGSGDAHGRGSGASGGDTASRGGKKSSGKKDLGTIHRDLFTRPEGLDKRGTDPFLSHLGFLCICCLQLAPHSISGKTGDRFMFNVNFVRILSNMDFTISQYHVGFDPEIDSKQVPRIS